MKILSRKLDFFLVTTIGASSTFISILLCQTFRISNVSPMMWLVLVVGVDVSHVYASLYRTYFANEINKNLKIILIFTPLFCFGLAFLAAQISSSVFWTILVYIAVFHFSRQQIGFLSIYTDHKDRNTFLHLMNEVSIYIFTLGSVLAWHSQGPKFFQWFIKNDFIFLQSFSEFEPFLKFFIIFWWILSTSINIYALFKKMVSSQAVLLLNSTFISWFIPIVLFNSDFIFTFTNIISHGIPYMVLVYSKEKERKTLFYRIEIFLGLLFFFAFLEEAMWDSLIWREHKVFFEGFYFVSQFQTESFAKALVLAVLISPQLIHYILDGFIWKKKYS